MTIREEPPSIEIASLVSSAFLASPVFAGIDEIRYKLDAILGSMEKGRTLVAREEVAMGSITLFPPNPKSPCETFHSNPSFGLLAVDSARSGHGIARELIAAVEELAARIGHEAITLSVTQRGQLLIDFYGRLGFRALGEFQWPEAVDPSLIMIKSLRAD
jgi:GNAT superfamily N-acetyltransferase